MNIMNEHCKWTLKMNIMNEHCKWTLWMKIVNENYERTLQMNIINEHYEWNFWNFVTPPPMPELSTYKTTTPVFY